ncbi:MAG: hypothetical protein A2147_05840 [Chloroflexi bacterium RBG_16_57_8]|nr:MAG: hypothetical protein A2147_05840 [Chloroflexi bacterium RBG_16_57_8]
MFHKILVCLDGSKSAERILPYVSSEARKFNAKVVLLHVSTRDLPAYALPSAEPVRFIPIELLFSASLERQARMKDYLNETAQRLRTEGLSVECVTVSGLATDISDIIVRHALENDVDLIAMVTRGFTGWRRLLYGSITDSVTRKSSLPVLTLRPGPGKGAADSRSEFADDRMSVSTA